MFAKNWRAGPTWVPATVVAQTGPISFKVELENSKTVWRRHQDQLRKRYKELTNKETDRTDKEDTLSVHSDSLMDVDGSSTDTSTESFDIGNEEQPTSDLTPTPIISSAPTPHRNPIRTRKPPDRLTL